MPTIEEMLAKHGVQPAPYMSGPLVRNTVAFHRQRSRAEGYRDREKRLIDNGYHPTGVGPLSEDTSLRCKTCVFHVYVANSTGSMARPKCRRMSQAWTPGRASDCLPSWPACSRHEQKPKDEVPDEQQQPDVTVDVVEQPA